MAENNNQSIFIINAQGGYDSAGQTVTEEEYNAWVQDNAVTAEGTSGVSVDIVGGDDKISVTDGTTTVGYNNVQQPSNGTGATSYNTIVRYAADDTITNDQALAFLQQNVDTALALKESIVTELNARGQNPDNSLTIIDGVQAYTLDAAEGAIDVAYAALFGYKDNLPALVAELQDLALQTIAEYQADVEGGLTVKLPTDLTPFDGQVTSTTVNTTGSNLAKSSITSLADVTTDTTLPTIDEGDTKIQTVEVTANTSVTKAIKDSLGLPYQGPILDKLIDKAINLGLNQIPGYSQVNSIIGTTNKIVKLGDIATNVEQTPAEVALALARLFVPQVNLLVQGYNLINGGNGFLGAGGGGAEDEFPPGDIDYGPVAVDNSDPAALATNNAENEFVDNGTGLLVLPEDQFVETDGGLYKLPEEVETDIENSLPEPPNDDPSAYPNGLPYDDEGNLNPGWAINPETGEPYYAGGDYVDPGTQALAQEARQQATLNNARKQAALQAQRSQANDGDWRVRLRLAPGANYLYKLPANEQGILQPLAITDGVVFPYMPQIDTNYHANYNEYDLTHSNYRGYFYRNSYVGEINLRATFTAQDSAEASYVLAVIHFFRSVTKMFYGQDAQRGAPPPMVFLEGLGEYQFNLHSCVVSNFNYTLPNDVDYIRARSPNVDGTSLLQRRDRQSLPTNPFDAVLARISAAGLKKGAITSTPAPAQVLGGINRPTYVPTKLEMNLTLLPIQTREQVSKEFSLKQFANGQLIKGGFW